MACPSRKDRRAMFSRSDGRLRLDLYASHVKRVHRKPHLSAAQVRVRMLGSTRFKRDAYDD